MPATATQPVTRSNNLRAYRARRTPEATAELGLSGAQRAADLALIFKHTHSDYRGTGANGPTILVLRGGGTTVVPIAWLDDREFADHLSVARRREARS